MKVISYVRSAVAKLLIALKLLEPVKGKTFRVVEGSEGNNVIHVDFAAKQAGAEPMTVIVWKNDNNSFSFAVGENAYVEELPSIRACVNKALRLRRASEVNLEVYPKGSVTY